MSLWWHRLPNFPCQRLHYFYVQTFIKRFAATSISTSNRHYKAVQTRAVCSHQVEDLNSRQKEQIFCYVDALLEWNQRMNLTAVTRTSEVMKRHVADSLAIIPPIQNTYVPSCGFSCDGLNIVDVGSGPGLPGLIFAIACPSWKITLLESMHKRCLFLEHVISLISLSNVQVICARAEDVGQNRDFRETFDVAVARAVAEMRVLAEYCLPLVRVGGLFVAAKGHNPEEEVHDAEKAIRLMGASTIELCHVDSHSPLGQRTAVVCIKNHPTPRKYPREAGVISKTPL